jgi:uncharacterized protein YqiB (DUF1249 family)
MSVYETIFKRLQKLGVNMDNPQEYAKSTATGFMDLNLNVLYREKDSFVISLSHYYTAGGDQVADPDMEIRVYPKTRMAEALTYQDSFSYQKVYPEPGKVYPKRKKELNVFLAKWILNCIRQGHHFTEGGSDAKAR